MSVVSFFRRSILTNPFVALGKKYYQVRNIPRVYDHGKSANNIFSNKRIPAQKSSRTLRPILVAGFAILILCVAGLHGQVQLRRTGERDVQRGRVRAATDYYTPRRIEIRPIRALVDASKDGGIWWYPQYAGTGFDPNQRHQGKAMADAMRARGWEVTELPRGEVITPDRLQDFDIVIRPEPYSLYSASEANAYREAVADGVRLLLMGSAAGYDDRVAAVFGLRFGGSRHIAIEKFIQHSLTAGIELLAIPWVTVLEEPQESVVLAWGANEDPIFGYLSFSAGYVLFAGTSSCIFEDPLRINTLEFLDSNSAYDLHLPFLASAIVISTAGPPAPALIRPEPGEVLPQPDAGEWLFRWEEVPGAQKYQIAVLGAKASLFLINDETTSTSFVIPQGSGYIVDRNTIGWRWCVRAQGADGQWGNWSEERLFDVAYLQ
jgi:hypothetical protein